MSGLLHSQDLSDDVTHGQINYKANRLYVVFTGG